MQTLLDLYGRWRDLSDQEGGAITAGEWNCVASCQAAKQNLRGLIEESWSQLRCESGWEADGRSEIERRLRPVVSELLALEERNAEWLALQRKKGVAQDQQLRQSWRTLRQVQQAYR